MAKRLLSLEKILTLAPFSIPTIPLFLMAGSQKWLSGCRINQNFFFIPLFGPVRIRQETSLTGLISPTQSTQNQQSSFFLKMNKKREIFRHKKDTMVQKKENSLRKVQVHVSGRDLLQEMIFFENISIFS